MHVNPGGHVPTGFTGGGGGAPWVPKTATGRAVQAVGQAVGGVLAWIFKWIGRIVATVFLLFCASMLIYVFAFPVVSAVADLAIAASGTLVEFGVPSLDALLGNAVAGALVGFVVGGWRFQQRRYSTLAKRIVEILGEADLLSLRTLGVATVAGHMVAGIAAGALLAWVGFPDPSLGEGLSAVRDTPLVLWAAGTGGGGGFGGGGAGLIAIAPWAGLLWFAAAVLILCALVAPATVVAMTLVATVVSSTVFSSARTVGLALAIGLAPALPDSPFRDGQVFMRERVHRALGDDDGRRFMIGGAIASGAATGLITTALLMAWSVLTTVR